jgi:uncharacterized protein YggE
MKTMMRAAALSLVLAAGAGSGALAQTAAGGGAAAAGADAVFRATTLSLAAYGETRLAPDMATINLGVTTDGGTAQAAMQANAKQMNQVMAALKRGGIAAKDVQTSQLSVEPQYVYEQNLPPKLTGYRAVNQVTVTVHDLAKLGEAVDATVAAGANQAGGITFGLDDPTAAENAAREKAVKALAAKADLYAKATGYRVLRLVSLSEGGGYAPPPPMPMVAMSARFKETDTAVAAGEVRVRVDVGGVYELSR